MNQTPATTTPVRRSTPSRRRRATTVTTLVLVGLLAAAAVLLFRPADGTSPGAWLNELRGQTETDRYAELGDVPAGTAPSWLPEGTSDLTVKRPGESSGEDRDQVKVDGTTPDGWSLPAACTAASGYSMPFDGGGTWPLTTSTALSTCPDGDSTWETFVEGDRVYAWRVTP